MTFDQLPQPLVIYDGTCRFCHGSIDFILSREKDERLHFAWLQTEGVRAALIEGGFSLDADSLFLLEEGKLLEKSDAAIAISAYFRRPWSLLEKLSWLPRGLRNSIYDLIARYRKRIMGSMTCTLPMTDRDRFIG
jgi:predicted DCC family thiol-disulfide oxidoreductase YuxK